VLRDYQQRTIRQLYDWFEAGNTGNPCIVLPTGAGKSHIVAALCKDALTKWPQTRVLMLTHVKELIQQNAEKMRQHWPNAPMGIYSAGLRSRRIDSITFAGIQSVHAKARRIGRVDLVIIDECHLVSHKAEGGYRQLLDDLTAINPALRVIGLTATPYRLGHGYITDPPALFNGLVEPVTIEELVYKGFLASLRSKVTETKLDAGGVKKRGGEYVEADLQRVVDKEPLNVAVVDEVIDLAGDRKAWLFFCAGVDHAHNVSAALNARGIPAACITGKTPSGERARIIADFKAGRLRALTNANVLTTGFDHPSIDLIAMLRPTMSPGLYVQMAGRGLRLKPHTDHCLVLDFAGVVKAHGPITAVQEPRRKGEASGDAPMKVCDPDDGGCGELVHLSARECPACGKEFPPPEPQAPTLHNDDIMGADALEMDVTAWTWRVHTSRSSGKDMFRVSYYGDLAKKPVVEYFPVTHDGYVGHRARAGVAKIADKAGARLANTLEDAVNELNKGTPPAAIRYRMDGKFHRVTGRKWDDA
jgi:DNA repair protein RadD